MPAIDVGYPLAAGEAALAYQEISCALGTILLFPW